MNINTPLVLILCLCGLAPAQELADDGSRVFSNQSGVSIDAHVVDIRGDRVTLHRADNGKEYTIAISTLSEEDQQFLQEWQVLHPDLQIEVEGLKRRAAQEDWPKDAPVFSMIPDMTDWEAEFKYYELEIRNAGREVISDLELEYTFVVNREFGDERTDRSVPGGTIALPPIKGIDTITVESIPTLVGQGNQKVVEEIFAGLSDSTYRAFREDLVGIEITLSHRGNPFDKIVIGKSLSAEG